MTAGATFWASHAWIDTPGDLSGRTSPAPGATPLSGLTSKPSQAAGSALAGRVRIEVADGRINAVTTGADPQPGDVRLAGVVFPGFANAHSHAFHRALRGRTHHDGGSFWTWRERMYAVAERLTPDTYYALARAVYTEMLLSGVTVVGEFHYLHHTPDGTPYADPNVMGHALVAAAADAGLRMTLLDTCYLTGAIGSPLEGAQRRFGDGTADRWIGRIERLRDDAKGAVDSGPGVLVGAAVHSVRAVPEPEIRAVAGWARDTGVPLHMHLSEQVAENTECLAAYGRTPAQVLADAGALGPATTAVHATHLTDDDVRLLGESGTAVCGCPTTEQDLADGISPIGRLATAGSPVCLGSDQHAVVDLITEARLLEMHERLAGGERGRFTPSDLVAALTRDGHAALGRPTDGRIAPGATADLVAVRTDTVRTAGSDPEQLIMSATAADVATVVVGGRIVVDDGHHELSPMIIEDLSGDDRLGSR